MKAYIVHNSCYRETAKQVHRCLASFSRFSGWEPELFDGCHPGTLAEYEAKYGIGDDRAKYDPSSLRYASKKSCFYSHYALWLRALDGPIVVVEYDTECVADWAVPVPADGVVHLSLQTFAQNRRNKYALNWPGEAKSLARQQPGVYNILDTQRGKVKTSMPGNTAYLITPSAAQILIDDCKQNGWHQNDGAMKHHLLPLLYVIPSPIAYIESADRHTSHWTVSQSRSARRSANGYR